MKHYWGLRLFQAVGILSLLTAAMITHGQEKKKEVPVFGNWQGTYTTDNGESGDLRAQIVGDSGDEYHAIFFVDDSDDRLIVKGKTTKGVTHFEGDIETDSGSYHITGDARYGEFKGRFTGDNRGTFVLKRVLIKPPTLGLEPPEGAVVLMGKSQEDFQQKWIIHPHWQMNKEGVVRIEHSSLVTQEEFGDMEIHFEFMTDYMPNERGQGRSNSGLYVQGRYEIQILDSFGQEPKDNLCGGIYQQAVPRVDAVLPPLEWQTYDITFRAPRFDENGNKTKNAVIHVKHNGKVIHDNLELTKATPGGASGREAPKGVLLLQDHSDRPFFRNVWVKPLSE